MQSLPRPLKGNEFFCHRCEKFVPLSEHEAHNKKHALEARAKGAEENGKSKVQS